MRVLCLRRITRKYRFCLLQSGLEGPRVQRYDKLSHIRMTEIAADQFELLGSVVPPRGDMRRLKPALDRRQVVGGHGAKLVHRATMDQACNVSTVTLRLV